VAIRLREEDLDLGYFAFAVKLRRVMKENGMNEAQMESILVDFTYCQRHNVEPDRLIYTTYHAFTLAANAGIDAHEIPEHIEEGRKIIEELEILKERSYRKKTSHNRGNRCPSKKAG
jgi:hypothetical protein